jgi:hypothetical protein
MIGEIAALVALAPVAAALYAGCALVVLGVFSGDM